MTKEDVEEGASSQRKRPIDDYIRLTNSLIKAYRETRR
jgi:hypothetical protein